MNTLLPFITLLKAEENKTYDTKISEDELREYVLNNKKDYTYEMRMYLNKEMETHAIGHYQDIVQLLGAKFPSEPLELTNYRLRNLARVTKTYFSKICNTLSKINNADDFIIKHKKTEIEKACEENFDDWGSIRNWFFTIGLKAMLIDPNAYIFVKPILDASINKLLPELDIIKSCNIIHDCDEYILIKYSDKFYYYFDEYSIKEIEVIEDNNNVYGANFNYQKTTRDKFTVNDLFVHNLGKIPLVKLGGVPYLVENDDIYESFVAGVVPFWNQALIEFSDKQAAIKQHVYPEKWRILSGSCAECGGNGKHTFRDSNINCSTCGGSGNPPTGVFSEILIELGGAMDEKTPIPPIGYVQKEFSAIEYLDKDYIANIYYGLAAVNMEFISQTPLNQSGVSKEYDRSEFNAFLYQIARHITTNILTPIYDLVINWMYYDTETSTPYGDVSKLMPSITTPQQFDSMSTNDYETKIQNAKNAGLSKSIIQQLEKKYIEKKFVNFNDEKKYLLLINELNPHFGKTYDELTSLFDKKAITEEDYVLATNIEGIMYIVMDTYSGFFGYPLTKKKEILATYVNNIIENNEIEENNVLTTNVNDITDSQVTDNLVNNESKVL